MDRLHRRHIEIVLAVVSAVLGVITVADPGWLEWMTGRYPHRGSSGLEWGVTAVLAALAIVTAVSARRRHQRLLAQRETGRSSRRR